MTELDGQVALVTGGSRGIGFATARLLAERGARVVVSSRHAEDVEAAVLRLGGSGLQAEAAVFDVTDEGAVDSAIGGIVARHGRLDILVNNAGSSGPPAPIWETSTAFFDGMMRVHLFGAFFCMRAVIPTMIAAGYGRIVNMASVAGKEGNPEKGPYSAAKAGLIGLTKTVAKELATSGVLVNAVAPAITTTELLSQSDPAHIAMLAAKIPLGRPATAEEVAEMTVWAASPRCSFTTGAVFDVTGGRTTY